MQMLVTRSKRPMGEPKSADVASTRDQGRACDRARGRELARGTTLRRGQARSISPEPNYELKGHITLLDHLQL